MIYLEGTDGVGKTVTIEKLKEYGIVCQDRNKEVISKHMLFDVSMEKRIQVYEQYLKKHDDLILFLINNDKEELWKRIHSRDKISAYDLETNEYNQLYLKTYNEMKKRNMLHNKLFLIDCTHLNLEQQVNKVKQVIEDYYA